MGSVRISGLQFLLSLSEIAGYKCGLAIGRNELIRIFDEEPRLSCYVAIQDHSYLRLHSSEYEDAVEALLYKLGRLERPRNDLPGIELYHRYKGDQRKHEMVLSILAFFKECMVEEIEACRRENRKMLDPTIFILRATEAYGEFGLETAMHIISRSVAFQEKSPWGRVRHIQWKNTIELRSLFESEGLNSYYGEFIDQRYIDYLHRNFNDLDRMHWRKFEQLTAEWFSREGYQVELGPGRGDDGVDVRAWLSKAKQGLPPHIIIQCKRQKASVEKTIIKALYADVIHEGAVSGLLVTSSRLSPGAEETRSARSYPVQVADRATLKTWLEIMRVPGAGFTE